MCNFRFERKKQENDCFASFMYGSFFGLCKQGPGLHICQFKIRMAYGIAWHTNVFFMENALQQFSVIM